MPTFGSTPFGTATFGGTSTSISTCGQFDIVAMLRTIMDEPTGGVFWPDQTLFDALNDAQIDQMSLSWFPMTTTTMTFTQGGDLVPLPTDQIMIPKYLEYQGMQYFFTTHAELERYLRNWRNATEAQPFEFVLWDESHLRPYPLADQTYIFNLWGVQWPVEVNAIVTDITAPDLLKQAIAFRAASRLFTYTRPDLAAAFLTEAEEIENKWRIQLRNYQSHNIRRLRPYTAYTRAQSGSIRIGMRMLTNSRNPYIGP